jgi:hypothetical protein
MFVAVWAVASGGTALLVAPRAIGHDQAALLRNGMEIATGALPFRDVVDINSPVIHYFNAIPALAAAFARTNPIPWFTVVVLLLSAWSAVLSDRAFRSMSPDAQWTERLAVLLVPLGPGTVHLLLAEPGQREHLCVLLYFPFLLSRVAAAVDKPVGTPAGRYAIGLAAAIGVAMKPHFIVPALAFEAALLLAHRKPRLLIAPEVFGAVSVGLILVAALTLLPFEAREVLTGQVLPSVRHGYVAYGAPNAILFRRAGVRLLVFAVLAAVVWRLGPRSFRPALLPVTAFFIGALLSTILQGKAFGYHYIPADAALILLTGGATAGLVAGDRFQRLRPVAITVIVAVMIVWRPVHAWWISRPDAYPFRAVLSTYTDPGDAIMVMSLSPTYVAPAAMQLDRVDVARQSAFLYVLARQADATLQTPGRLEGRVLRELADEIGTRRPRAIFLDRAAGCPTCPPGMGVAALLEGAPQIREALGAYEQVAVAMNFDVYRRR